MRYASLSSVPAIEKDSSFYFSYEVSATHSNPLAPFFSPVDVTCVRFHQGNQKKKSSSRLKTVSVSPAGKTENQKSIIEGGEAETAVSTAKVNGTSTTKTNKIQSHQSLLEVIRGAKPA